MDQYSLLYITGRSLFF